MVSGQSLGTKLVLKMKRNVCSNVKNLSFWLKKANFNWRYKQIDDQ
jgi:hypothetical protein